MNLDAEENGRYPVIRVALEGGRQLSHWTRMSVLRRDRYQCVFCGHGGRLEVDHIIPWSAGGSDDPDNLRTLCHRCNQTRSNFRVPADDERRLPNGTECVYCTPSLLGEPLTAIYCGQCNKKAAGIPDDPKWHPDTNREPFEFTAEERVHFGVDAERTDLDEIAEKYRDAAVATIRAALNRGGPHA